MGAGFFSLRFVIKFVVTIAALGLFAVLVAFVVLYNGLFSFAANERDPRIFYKVVHSSFKQWVAQSAEDITVPDTLDDPAMIALGAQHYAQNCTRCHGGPGLGQNPMALAMNPTPQHLPAVVDQFDDAGLFVILKNGVKLSAMPAWPARDRDDEIWSMVAFTRQLDTMDAATYLDLVTPDMPDAPAMPFGTQPELAAMDYKLQRYPIEEHLYASPTGGFADYALAGAPVAQCSTCHGADGGGAATGGMAPNLTIQSPEYIRAALESYASADRHSAYMLVVASQLSDDQIGALANYYGETLPDVAPTLDVAPPVELIEAGAQLATAGRPEDGITACYDCHGEGGAGEVLVPALSGQTQPFIQVQLRKFREGGRGQTSAWSPMTGVAHNLTDEDIASVAAYFATQEPAAAPPEAPSEAPATPEQTSVAMGLVEGVCKECHEATLLGAPSGETPNLTLQRAGYVERQLYDFRNERRDNSRMHQTAIRLSEEEITALSAYIGGMESGEQQPPEPVSDDLALGERIAREGLPESDVPACLTCHGEVPTSGLDQLPHLHGQNGAYLASRLDYFNSADADDVTGYSPMPMIASHLEEDEWQAVAAWFAAQEPLPKQ